MVEYEYPVREIVGKPKCPTDRIAQEMNLCWWDKKIEDLGVGMEREHKLMHDPKVSWDELRKIFGQGLTK